MYKKLIETKIIRTKHEVSFHDGSTAFAIIQDLKDVPPKARLIDNNAEENTLTFEEETELYSE
jgi:hypothetical protein